MSDCTGTIKLKARDCFNLPAKMTTKGLQWVYNTRNVDFIKDVLITEIFCKIFLKKANLFIFTFTQIIYVGYISRIQIGQIRVLAI